MSASPGPGERELVLVHIGEWRLAFPRRDVRDLLSPQDLNTGNLSSGGGVSARLGSQDVPVLMLDDELKLAPCLQAERRICVVLSAQAFLFGLTCDEFEHQIVSPESGLTLHELSPAQRYPGSAVNAVLQYGSAVAAVTDAKTLLMSFKARLSQVMKMA